MAHPNLRTTRVPDFYFLPTATDKDWFVLAEDFGKVNLKGKMTESVHHYIHGFNLNPDPAKVLKQIEVTKEKSDSVLNLFGARGVYPTSKYIDLSRRRNLACCHLWCMEFQVIPGRNNSFQ